MITRWVFIWVLAGLVFGPAGSRAETVYVHSKVAPVMDRPGLGARKVAQLSQGDQLESDVQQNGWYHVVLDKGGGWVNRLMVKKFPPALKGTISKQTEEHLAQRARVRPSSLATTAAARGLRASRTRSSLRLRSDYEALEKMEKFRVSQQEVCRFLLKGSRDVQGR